MRRWIIGGMVAALGFGAMARMAVGSLAAADFGPPPLAALQRLDGKPAGLLDEPGRPTIVNLWATWCTPCLKEMPLLASFATERSDVQFLFVNSGETTAKAQAYLTREKLGSIRVLMDPQRQIARHYAGRGLPITLFLKADGSLSVMVTGEMTRELLDRNAALIAGTARR